VTILIRHFFGRFFDKESISPQGEPEAGVIQTLGLLAAPGAFIAILAMPLGFRNWDLVAFRFQSLSYSMIVMGVVMVFEWDALFPDCRDYQILTPLPLRLWTLFLAKLAALGIFLAIFLVDVNFFGVLFWPSIEDGPIWVHLTVVVAAGLFSALAIAALQGVLVTLFSGAMYRRISICVQTGLMAALVMLFFLTPLIGFAIEQLCRTNSPYLNWFPGFWFAGLHEQLQPALRADSTLRGLGPLATRGIWCVLAIFLSTFLAGYRRHARRVLETAEPSWKGGFKLSGIVARWLLRDPVESGVFHFIGQTLARSVKHRLFLATYGGFGVALAVMTLAAGDSTLELPFMLSFVLISGLRAAFNFPSELAANWAFQVTETSSVSAYVRGTRKWVALFAILPLFLLIAAVDRSLFHFAFGVTASVLLMELLFLDFRKVPFTCSHFPGKVNLVFLSAIYVFGFTLYSSYLASLEIWLARTFLGSTLFFLCAAAVLVALNRWRGEQEQLDYEDSGNLAVVTLDI